ncbi:addiction module toxin RelE [Thalassospira profundimaris]|uniref:Addiction module toxin RelE n=1 Tax=Thalassospira profundimaris TaxID=502049 RepID=A0A367X8A4_9PROT|nr:type II toxin-antitoxin system RelE/ParE family toxin [Thalassospira profundimaris]RCK49883.1 addiction module toxin RelE [Thalassospira profundimaris]
MRVFLNKSFRRFARKEKISHAKLLEVVGDASRGIIDADLGGGVLKQRIARPGEGKSGGYRAIIFFRRHERTFFIYGYAKKDLDNITEEEQSDFRKLAGHVLGLSDETLVKLLEKKDLFEITKSKNGEQDDKQKKSPK